MTDEKVRNIYVIEARKQEQLNVFDKFLQYVQMLGSIGASRKIELFVDGDGEVQFKICKMVGDELVRIDQCEVSDDIGYGFIKTKNEDKNYFSLG